jgi:hypothetical protein
MQRYKNMRRSGVRPRVLRFDHQNLIDKNLKIISRTLLNFKSFVLQKTLLKEAQTGRKYLNS